MEEDVSGSMADQYVWSPVYIDAMIERDTPSQRLYVQQDANWNVTAILDSSGNVQERYLYDPFGNFIVLTPNWSTRGASSFSWVYLFQGGRYDGTSSVYDFRNRDYTASLGRWIQTDPTGYSAGDANLYCLDANAPISWTDPGGEKRTFAPAPAFPPPPPQTIPIPFGYSWSPDNPAKDPFRDYTRCVGSVPRSFPPNPSGPDRSWSQQDVIDAVRSKCGENCVKEVEDFFKAVKSAPPRGTDRLHQCCTKFIGNINSKPWGGSCMTATTVEWDLPVGLGHDWCLGHQALKVTVCNSITFYVDDAFMAGIGNNDHIFGPGDISWYYQPAGTVWFPKQPPTTKPLR